MTGGKRALLLNDRVLGGGSEQVLYQVINHLLSRGWRVTVVALRGTRRELAVYCPGRLRFFSLRKPWKYGGIHVLGHALCRAEQALLRLFLNLRPFDAVLAMKEGPCMVYGAGFRAKKKLAWVHTDYARQHWTRCMLTPEAELACMRRYDQVVCVSGAVRAGILGALGDPGNLVVRLNPIDADAVRRKAAAPLPPESEPPERPLLLSLALFMPQKGILRLLDCCAQLQKEFDFTLWLVGDGELRGEAEAYIAGHGLRNVKLWGAQRNPYPFLRQADWLVSASYGESYGLAVQEAVLLNVPVLAASCPAFEECVPAGKAILTENSDEGLREGLRRILTHPELGEELRRAPAQSSQQALFADRLQAIEALLLP